MNLHDRIYIVIKGNSSSFENTQKESAIRELHTDRACLLAATC